MAVRTHALTWQRRVVVLVTILATALGVAVLAGPGAEAAKPTPPPPTAQLQIQQVLDQGITLPGSAAAGTQEGLIRSGLPFDVTVQSQTLAGAPLVITTADLQVILSGGGVNAVLTIEKGKDTGTLSGLVRNGSSNFVLSASGPKKSSGCASFA